MKKLRSGFTLIELLIVIGVLGILAAGLLAAVDPFEQLKKGRDTNRRNVVVEFHNANIRYYATHGDLAWNVTGGCTAYSDGTAATSLEDLYAGGVVGVDCIAPLIDDGELKTDFYAAMGSDASKIYLYSGTGVDLSVCFSPESKSIYNDEATKWSVDGQTNRLSTDCDATTKKSTGPAPAVGACYWCAK